MEDVKFSKMLEHPKSFDPYYGKVSEIGQSAGQSLRLAWLAGIWDGEGSITVFWHQEKMKPQICLTNTNATIISEATKILDELGITMHVVEYTRPKSKLIYQLTTSKLDNLKKFCEALTPYLVGKKSQAELLYRYVNSRLSKITDGNGWNQNTKYSESEKELQKEIQSLNHRGKSSETTR